MGLTYEIKLLIYILDSGWGPYPALDTSVGHTAPDHLVQVSARTGICGPGVERLATASLRTVARS